MEGQIARKREISIDRSTIGQRRVTLLRATSWLRTSDSANVSLHLTHTVKSEGWVINVFIYLFIFDCWWGWGSIHTLPVVRLISMARWRWPRTLNWGRETSLLTPTLFGPSFHLYRMSLIVYPTEKIERPPAVGTYLRGSPQTRFSSEGASTYLAPPSKPQQVRSLYFPLFLIIYIHVSV